MVLQNARKFIKYETFLFKDHCLNNFQPISIFFFVQKEIMKNLLPFFIIDKKRYVNDFWNFSNSYTNGILGLVGILLTNPALQFKIASSTFLVLAGYSSIFCAAYRQGTFSNVS